MEMSKEKKYKVVTLCGSTRFKEEFEKVQRELTLQGNIVLSVGLFSHAEDNGEEWINDDTKQMLNDLHKRKIDMADEIFVINVDGYIGDSTKSEIEYAKQCGKKVTYLFNEKFLIYYYKNPLKNQNKTKICIVDTEAEAQKYVFDNQYVNGSKTFYQKMTN